jgi:hypothetical protein
VLCRLEEAFDAKLGNERQASSCKYILAVLCALGGRACFPGSLCQPPTNFVKCTACITHSLIWFVHTYRSSIKTDNVCRVQHHTKGTCRFLHRATGGHIAFKRVRGRTRLLGGGWCRKRSVQQRAAVVKFGQHNTQQTTTTTTPYHSRHPPHSLTIHRHNTHPILSPVSYVNMLSISFKLG